MKSCNQFKARMLNLFRENNNNQETEEDSLSPTKYFKPENSEALFSYINIYIDKHGPNCDLNHIDVSEIKDMSFLFYRSEFNGDISKWDVSNVKDMSNMFLQSEFNGDISNWKVSNVTNMSNMFSNSKFNGDISKWDVSKVEEMFFMFSESKFNGDISKWNVSNVVSMNEMFIDSQFNGDISNWDVSNVNDMSRIFEYSTHPNPPYWSKIEDLEERKNAVKAYKADQEKKFLSQNIEARPTPPKTKFKI